MAVTVTQAQLDNALSVLKQAVVSYEQTKRAMYDVLNSHADIIKSWQGHGVSYEQAALEFQKVRDGNVQAAVNTMNHLLNMGIEYENLLKEFARQKP